jgi:histone deacetylase 6
MGFCFFNNVAVAAKWLQVAYPEKIKKIMILDWFVLAVPFFLAA